jgi:hypothetical protein
MTRTVYEVAEMDEQEVLRLATATIRRHPTLEEVFDTTFLQRLARRRRLNNYLLWLLAQTEDSEYSEEVWATICCDLHTLRHENSLTHFRRKLRMWERETFFVARGELGIAAGVKRRGFDIELEPATGNGKRCDFRAMTDPPTWWEIKALGEIERVADDDRIVREVQSGLRRIPEPYALAIEESNVALGDVQRAVKKIKNEIASYFRDRKKPPATFSAFGLNVKVMARSNLGYGYVGITNFQGYVFGDEHSARAADRIVDALAQLPKGECGVVVIDATCTRWLNEYEILDACFGPLQRVYDANGNRDEHDAGRAAFQPHHRTRISAVVLYTTEARFVEEPKGAILVVHNPFARVQLDDSFFCDVAARQTRCVPAGNGRFLVRTTPELGQ